MVRLIHTEKQGFLAADRPLYGNKAEAFLRIYKGDYKEEHNSVNCIWEIETNTARIRGNTCKLKKMDNNIGGQLHQEYRLRHLISGQLLSFTKHEFTNAEDQKKELIIPCLGPHPDEKGSQNTEEHSKIIFKPTTFV